MNTYNHNFSERVSERERQRGRERGGEKVRKAYQANHGITIMRHITTFQSTTHHIYDGGPIRL